MSKTRVHSLSIHKNDLFDESKGAYAALGGPFVYQKLFRQSTLFNTSIR